MRTLIELYDERAIENFLGVETFKPEKVIYVCPPEVVENHVFEKTAKTFLNARMNRYNARIQIEIVESSLFKSDKIYKRLLYIVENNPDCVIDITGGTDAALFAAGMICKEKNIPAFTYSRKKNRFYDICFAKFADKLLCDIEYRVADFFAMTGGRLCEGRVSTKALNKWEGTFEELFDIYLKYKRNWLNFINYMIRISQPKYDHAVELRVSGAYIQKGDRGSRIPANEELLRNLSNMGYLKDLKIRKDSTESESAVSFCFADVNVRFWLRDVGSFLELYMYRKCLESGLFGDVVTSALVEWDGTNTKDSVINEIDVVASRGVVPLFISCKACDIKTESINELALLKERFGGKGAKALIVTTENVTSAARHRASQLGITILDIEELRQNRVIERLEVVMKVREEII